MVRSERQCVFSRQGANVPELEKMRPPDITPKPSALSPEIGRQLERLAEIKSMFARERIVKVETIHKLNARRADLYRTVSSISPEQAGKEPARTEFIARSFELQDLSWELASAEQSLGTTRAREGYLRSIERDKTFLDNPERLSFVLDALERDPDWRPVSTATLPPAPGSTVDAMDEKAVLASIGDLLAGGGSEDVHRAFVIIDSYKDLADRSPRVDEVRKALSIEDPERGRLAALDCIEALRRDHALDIERLENRTLADIEPLREAWSRAVEAGTKTYEATRERFWRSLHPDSNLGSTAQSIAAREVITNAGYTFDGVLPGLAPRMVTERSVARNEAILSLQHDFPQHLSHRPELERLKIDPANIRFATLSDNILEDRKYYQGPAASESRHLRGELETARRIARAILADPRMSDGERARLRDSTQVSFRELERHALSSIGMDAGTVAELDATTRTQTRVVEELRKNHERPGLPVVERARQLASLERAELELEHHLERVSEAMLLVSCEVAASTAAVKQYLAALARGETIEQMEVRVRMELEIERAREAWRWSV
jgi:hypothetical protein